MSLPPPFDNVDQAQVARHAQLLEMWRGLTPLELLADLTVLTQMLYFAEHQHQVLITAKAAVAAGGTHDCGEWIDDDHNCHLCGQRVLRRQD